MSKLFKLREWLSVAEAARHLTIVFGEEVIEADVLRLALDGHLKISINFVNEAKAKRGQIVSWEETEWLFLPPLIKTKTSSKNTSQAEQSENRRKAPPKLKELWERAPINERDEWMPIPRSIDIDGQRFLNMSDGIVTLTGVWDLAMCGNEKLDVEHRYQMLIGGPSVTLQNIDGVFVYKSDKEMYQLQEDYENNEFQSGSAARLERLKQEIANGYIEKSEAERLLNQYKEDRKKFLEIRFSNPESVKYYQAGGIPEDSALVVRTKSLREFEQKITGTPELMVEKPISTTERNSLLTIIGLMAKDGYRDDLTKPYALAKEIMEIAEQLGIKISDDTIANKLKEARKVLIEKHE